MPHPWGRTQGLKDTLIPSIAREGARVVGLCIDRCIIVVLKPYTSKETDSLDITYLCTRATTGQYLTLMYTGYVIITRASP